ncbi:transglycosylase, SLT family [Treponema primitia ZAS-2]|uniref:Transglycosylase, SLT family n=1 Tax=Treponema primitia (strain ATCC BAA-887 / DSM 12427 / ZAS-2) TaxID=545694 RepID=F5YPG4_TREPZ|nr:transglycosylase, SLT family [Treponema primitia ZAS-2]
MSLLLTFPLPSPVSGAEPLDPPVQNPLPALPPTQTPVTALSPAPPPASPENQAAPEPAFPRPLRQVYATPPARLMRRNGSLPENTLSPALPGLNKPLTRHYIQQYSGKGGLVWLAAVMERAGPYIFFVRQEIRARNLPEELAYLPVIESGYLSSALSRSGAAGLWQFMRNSIGGYDMRITDYADERMDFWKSTQGALRKLEDNYKQLGDWPLALAAYNAGLGGVTRLIRETGIRDYWQLAEKGKLKTETAHYVPKLLAVSYILSNPRQFGFSPSWPEDPRWTRITLDRPVDLVLLAEYSGVNVETLKKGNPELRYTITPPERGYQLKVRDADAPAVLAALEREDLSLIRYYFHTVGYGDTLSALAQHYRLTVDRLLADNPGVNPRTLQIGSKLRIPAITDAGPYQRQTASGAGLAFEGTHLVKRGETLWSIALAYEVDPEVLAEFNGMGLNDTLREGRVLKTPIIK